MATIELRLSTKTDKQTGKSEIILRFYHGKVIDHNAKTGVYIDARQYWDNKAKDIKVKDRIITDETKYHNAAKECLNSLCDEVVRQFHDADKMVLPGDWLKTTVDKIRFPEKYNVLPEDNSIAFFTAFDEWVSKKDFSDLRVRQLGVLKRALQRFEMYVCIDEKRNFTLKLDTISTETVEDFESFLRNEHSLYEEEQYKELYERFPAITGSNRKTHKPQERGWNTIASTLHRLRSFFAWCLEQEYMTARPFEKYSHSLEERYGRPIYISLDERNTIADFDLSTTPHLEVQRDIFIFQCLIGCRVSDLMRLKPSNVINNAIQYIPHKTKDGRPLVVEVPLNGRASALLAKYKGVDASGRLFPFISSQNYNYAIKDVFKACGIDRVVTVINPKTGDEEQLPIHEVASSHMARRTFVGNLYKQVKDPNLVGSLSGHKEGSRAFARYRDIDRDMKNDLVKLLD